jgi:hypothetical protein
MDICTYTGRTAANLFRLHLLNDVSDTWFARYRLTPEHCERTPSLLMPAHASLSLHTANDMLNYMCRYLGRR